ncbi:hypothetical protein DYB36_006910 [Aphanomyces astaci]|uniref:DUF6818 domain-containing protein n=1 Tax=Aphanomyces astaci TaxID=112090 RepID=A0A397AAQ7_APHAT|nr:hypothetical protein DYB36_006910 [Aphanomyces astaci]
MATNSKAATRADSKRSAPNWNDKDVEILLDCIQDLVPLGQNGWAKVTQQFNAHNNVGFARDWEACKRKFTFLKSVKKPTGDPDCPPLVVRAKHIQRDIDSRAAVEVLDDEGEMNTDSLKTFFDQDVDHMPTLDVTPDVNVSENVAEEGDNDESQIDVTDNVDFKEEIDTSQTFLPLKRQKTSLKEKANRSGLSQDSLRQLGKRLSKIAKKSAKTSAKNVSGNKSDNKASPAKSENISNSCCVMSVKNVSGNKISPAKSENISNSCCVMSVKSADGAMKTSTALAKNNSRWQS